MFLLLSGFFAVGCTGIPVRTVTITRTLEQSALTPMPAAPRSASAPLRPGQLALEGGMSIATTKDPERTRYQASTGGKTPSANIYNDKAIYGRIAGAFNEYVEMGWVLDYASTSWGTTQSAVDSNLSEVSETSVWHTGPHLRVMPFSEPEGGFGFLLEFEFTRLAHARNIYEKAHSTDYEGGLPDKTQFLGQRLKRQTESTIYPIARFGFFGFGRIAGVTLTGGAAVQNAPVFFGTKRADYQCTYYDDAGLGPDGTFYTPDGQIDYSACEGVKNPDSVDAYETSAVFNLFLSIAYTLGPVTFQTQVSGNLAGEAFKVIPAVFDFSVRYAFDLIEPEPNRPVYKENYKYDYNRGY